MRGGAPLTDGARGASPLLGPTVALVALHSYVVGLALLLFPSWSVSVGGFAAGATTFFVRQGGVFHLVVATGYLIEYRRRQTVTLLLVAKATATLFLLGVWLLGSSPAWCIPLSGFSDGLMGLVTWHLARRATHPVEGPAVEA